MNDEPNDKPTPAMLAFAAALDEIEACFLAKQPAYGDSWASPEQGLFSLATAEDRIRIQIDKKLARIREIGKGDTEDSVLDLTVFLVMLRALRKLAKVAK